MFVTTCLLQVTLHVVMDTISLGKPLYSVSHTLTTASLQHTMTVSRLTASQSGQAFP